MAELLQFLVVSVTLPVLIETSQHRGTKISDQVCTVTGKREQRQCVIISSCSQILSKCQNCYRPNDTNSSLCTPSVETVTVCPIQTAGCKVTSTLSHPLKNISRPANGSPTPNDSLMSMPSGDCGSTVGLLTGFLLGVVVILVTGWIGACALMYRKIPRSSPHTAESDPDSVTPYELPIATICYSEHTNSAQQANPSYQITCNSLDHKYEQVDLKCDQSYDTVGQSGVPDVNKSSARLTESQDPHTDDHYATLSHSTVLKSSSNPIDSHNARTNENYARLNHDTEQELNAESIDLQDLNTEQNSATLDNKPKQDHQPLDTTKMNSSNEEDHVYSVLENKEDERINNSYTLT